LTDAGLANLVGWNLHKTSHRDLNVTAPAIICIGSFGQSTLIGLANHGKSGIILWLKLKWVSVFM
jgi:hypothetical protein